MVASLTSSANIASMLQTLQAHAKQASSLDSIHEEAPKSNFGDFINQAIGRVNDAQIDSQNTAQAFERGEPVPLTDVVLKMQKASLSFEATLQVRNKVLKAYEDIMNMPV
ncbi:MAG: flagellar hook-basal body complex protein FliE [Rhodoferax sp.]